MSEREQSIDSPNKDLSQPRKNIPHINNRGMKERKEAMLCPPIHTQRTQEKVNPVRYAPPKCFENRFVSIVPVLQIQITFPGFPYSLSHLYSFQPARGSLFAKAFPALVPTSPGNVFFRSNHGIDSLALRLAARSRTRSP